MQKIGVESLKKIIVLGSKLGNIAGKSMEDNKVNLADLVLLPGLVMVFPTMLEIDWSQAVPEAVDLSSEEAAELVACFCECFDIPQDDVEAKIENALKVVAKLVDCIQSLIKLFVKPAVAAAIEAETAPAVASLVEESPAVEEVAEEAPVAEVAEEVPSAELEA
jgi:hypothetical protein